MKGIVSAEKWKGLLVAVSIPVDESMTCLLSAALCYSQSRRSVDLESRSFVDTTLNTVPYQLTILRDYSENDFFFKKDLLLF